MGTGDSTGSGARGPGLVSVREHLVRISAVPPAHGLAVGMRTAEEAGGGNPATSGNLSGRRRLKCLLKRRVGRKCGLPAPDRPWWLWQSVRRRTEAGRDSVTRICKRQKTCGVLSGRSGLGL